MKSIHITQVPGETRQYMLDDDATVRDALDLADFGDLSGMTVQLDGQELDSHGDFRVGFTDESRVVISQRVKGN